ncbi:hypothetical protein DL98DRAFT_598649 [Cadophora sp. DSE1049]|nr:hypothetical protein DL98DRAFT_598649 [Cadophora sp. DSE1049]
MSDTSSQSDWFASDTDSSSDGEGDLLATYDIVVKRYTSLRGYHGDNIIIRKISNEDFPPSNTESSSQPTFRYKAYLHWGSFEGVFTCKASADEKDFSDFKMTRMNRNLKEEMQGDYTNFYFKDGVVDDNANPFMGFWMGFGYAYGFSMAIWGWAKLREESENGVWEETVLTDEEEKRRDDYERSEDEAQGIAHRRCSLTFFSRCLKSWVVVSVMVGALSELVIGIA